MDYKRFPESAQSTDKRDENPRIPNAAGGSHQFGPRGINTVGQRTVAFAACLISMVGVER
ncbi:MAG: hypothetical protein L0154_01345 [Chloroflexi bacterium]|nr:hypothetical protein [Chloroflexota bacterium]